VWFAPQLKREPLARFFRLNQVCVFPSLHPEAFGIVAAEAMASGLALVSTGVGGAAELFVDGISGLAYPAGDAAARAREP
jgi:glycosyltransferase involved in cell wall biosynthesis